MIEIVKAPTFRQADFETTGKRPGLSAIVNLKNEEDFAEASLNSILPFFDEIVIVFNGCTDRTPAISLNLRIRTRNVCAPLNTFRMCSPAAACNIIVNHQIRYTVLSITLILR